MSCLNETILRQIETEVLFDYDPFPESWTNRPEYDKWKWNTVSLLTRLSGLPSVAFSSFPFEEIFSWGWSYRKAANMILADLRMMRR